MTYLLDTNICIALLRGHANAVSQLAALPPSACAISSISVYELQTGVEKCQQPERERQKIDLLLNSLRLVEFDRDAAEKSAVVRVQLERIGTPIGPYDLLLAGHALARGLTMVTSDVGEFSRVSGVAIFPGAIWMNLAI